MSAQSSNLLNQFRPGKVIWPILIGLGFAGFMIWRDFEIEAWRTAWENWGYKTTLWILAAVAMMGVRDLAYMYRIRVLTDFRISFPRSVNVILLWEFASAITPSIVGGTAFALLLLSQEKISAGRSTAIVLTTAFLDELFYVLTVPLFLGIVGYDKMFSFAASTGGEALGMGMIGVFWLGYAILFVYTLLLAYGLFINPKGLKWLIVSIFKLRFLRRWKEDAIKAGDDMIIASGELRGKNAAFWIKSFGATALSWTGRYLVINFILQAFAIGGINVDHFIVYARQIFMWVIMLIPVTPGGAGLAELTFDQFLSEFTLAGLTNGLGLLWRLISYYPYLIIGAILLPRWITKKFGSRKKAEKKVAEEFENGSSGKTKDTERELLEEPE